jgi:hypothetical protein
MPFIELTAIKELAAQKVERDSFPVEFALALKEIRDNKYFYSYRCCSFSRFIRQEMPICRNTANSLIRIIDAFERIHYTRKQILELAAVSWAKLAEALPILTKENADYLILKAQTMRLREYRQLVEQAKRLTGLKQTA